MADEITVRPAPEADKHAQVMERYRALDLQIDANGVVQLTTDQQRRLFSYGYFNEKMAPSHYTSYKQVDEGIQMLQGMGCPALSNLEFLYFVGGKLTAMHRLCLAACQATGQMEKHHAIFVNEKNEQLSEKNLIGFQVAGCVVYVRRRGQENDALGAFTMEDAKAAGLTTRNKNWIAYSKDMCLHRASMRALSQHFADVLQGVQCTELQQYNQMLDDQGKPLQSADGSAIFQRKLQQRDEAAAAFEKLKQGTSN